MAKRKVEDYGPEKVAKAKVNAEARAAYRPTWQEQKAQIEALEARVKALESKGL